MCLSAYEPYKGEPCLSNSLQLGVWVAGGMNISGVIRMLFDLIEGGKKGGRRKVHSPQAQQMFSPMP